MADTTTHTYEYEVDLDSDSAPARVIRMAGHGKRILEVGAGPGSITKHLTSTNDCNVVAIEIDPTAIKKLKNFCKKVYSLNLNDPDWPSELDEEDRFDIVIAADVLEHVTNPLQTLMGMKSMLREGGEIILSLPHVGHCTIGACLLAEDFRYQDWGLLDRTHIQFFGLKNINRLYKAAGLGIAHAEFVVRTPRQTEFLDIWDSITELGRDGLLTNPHAFVYQVVSKAKLASDVENPIDLIALPVEVNDPYYTKESPESEPVLRKEPVILRYCRAAARKLLSSSARMRVRRLARKIGLKI